MDEGCAPGYLSGFNCHTSQAVAPTLPTSFPHRDKSYSWKLSPHPRLSSWAKCITSTCSCNPLPSREGRHQLHVMTGESNPELLVL